MRTVIDARNATGVPCITTCPAIIPTGILDLDLTTWQHHALHSMGFRIATTNPPRSPQTGRGDEGA